MYENSRVFIKKHTNTQIIKESGWIICGQFVSVIGSLALVRVLTEYLNPAMYGELTLALTITTLVQQIFIGGIAAGIWRFYSVAMEKGDFDAYLKASRRLFTYAILIIIILAIILLSALVIINQEHWIGLIVFIILFSIFSSGNTILNGIQNAARRRAVVTLHSNMDVWLKITLATVVILGLGASNQAVVIGYTLSALIVSSSQLLFLRQLKRQQSIIHSPNDNENWIKRIWEFSWPMSIWGIFTWSHQVSDRWALESFTSTHEIGQYAVLFQLGYVPMILLTELLVTLIWPILYEQSGSGNDELRNLTAHKIVLSLSLLCLVLTSIVCFFTWWLHGWIFQWLVAEAFRPVSFYLPWMILSGGFFATGQILALKLMSEIRTHSLLYVKVVTALIGITINILGAWWYGMNGVVTSLVISSAIYMFWNAYIALYSSSKVKCIS